MVSVCVEPAASPEFDTAPHNYAHWMLAHAYPVVARLQSVASEAGDWVVVTFILSAANWELRLWSYHYHQLLAPWAVVFLTWRPPDMRCDTSVRIRVPHKSFCSEDYFAAVPAFASFLRTRSVFPGLLPAAQPSVLVTFHDRQFSTSRTWDIVGLRQACRNASEEPTWLGILQVVCSSFSRPQPLAKTLQPLGAASAFIAGHGAGLANLVFMAPGARVLELDAVGHRRWHRFMYQTLAERVGLRPEKVWLDGRGRRHNLEAGEVSNCTQRSANGSLIVGLDPEALRSARILPYTSRARITSYGFAALLQDVLTDWQAARRARSTA